MIIVDALDRQAATHRQFRFEGQFGRREDGSGKHQLPPDAQSLHRHAGRLGGTRQFQSQIGTPPFSPFSQ